MVQATAPAFEPEFGAGWDQNESVGCCRKIVPYVGAFPGQCHVGDESMFKPSQEQPPTSASGCNSRSAGARAASTGRRPSSLSQFP